MSDNIDEAIKEIEMIYSAISLDEKNAFESLKKIFLFRKEHAKYYAECDDAETKEICKQAVLEANKVIKKTLAL